MAPARHDGFVYRYTQDHNALAIVAERLLLCRTRLLVVAELRAVHRSRFRHLADRLRRRTHVVSTRASLATFKMSWDGVREKKNS